MEDDILFEQNEDIIFEEKEEDNDDFGDIDYDEELINRYNFPLYIKKSIQELQGIATAIIYDNEVDDNEIRLLIEWLKAHNQIIDQYPLNELAPLVKTIIKEGKSSPELRSRILKTLSSFAADPKAKSTVENIFDTDCKINFKDRGNCKSPLIQTARGRKPHAM